jgi:hypothetical protein
MSKHWQNNIDQNMSCYLIWNFFWKNECEIIKKETKYPNLGKCVNQILGAAFCKGCSEVDK